MKFMDKKGRLFGKVNVVDLVVVLLLVFSVVAVVYKMQQTTQVQGGNEQIRYSVIVEYLRDVSVDALKEEAQGFFDPTTQKALGEVVDISVEPAPMFAVLSDGTYKLTDHPEKHNVLLTFETKGTETGEGYYTESGKQLMVGDTLEFANAHAKTSGEILSVEVVE